MKKTIGILAHVDAGKTTLSEQILYHAGAISSLGRVDHKDTFLDNNEIEQSRGITIFSGLAHFQWNGHDYYLIDTPGHIDFAGETERAVSVLDYAVLVMNVSAGIEAHTLTLFRLLKKYHIPTFFFLNKIDLLQTDLSFCLQDIKEKCTKQILYIESPDILKNPTEDFLSFAAELDDELLELFLEESLTSENMISGLIRAIKNTDIFPCISGSALNDQGVLDFLNIFDLLTETDYEKNIHENFHAKTYQIRHDKNGERLTFLKILSGNIQVRDTVSYHKNSPLIILPEININGKRTVSSKEVSAQETPTNETVIQEKINQIRCYHGASFTSVQTASSGDIIAVTGISSLNPTISDLTFRPALKSKITVKNCNDTRFILKNLRQLEAEDPLLNVTLEPSLNEIHLQIMGKIQLEILRQYLLERFSMEVTFDPPEILYKETIASPVHGCGHFEPLRHYAEVHFLLEPASRGSGICFESTCHVDMLSLNFQRLVRTHVFEKEHKGILTGSPLTDVKITLTKGRSHIKHTEGGDFREASYRAIRQALEHAENILLEPYYEIEIYADCSFMGRILSDIQKLNGTFETPEQSGNTLHILAFGPVACFMDYPAEFISFTKGTGNISMKTCGYDRCHNTEEVIERKAYNKDADLENVSCSVFCHKGESFLVPWDQAESFMHCQ